MKILDYFRKKTNTAKAENMKPKAPIEKTKEIPEVTKEQALELCRKIPDFALGIACVNDPDFGFAPLHVKLQKTEDGRLLIQGYASLDPGQKAIVEKVLEKDDEQLSGKDQSKIYKHPEWVYLYVIIGKTIGTTAILRINAGSEEIMQKEIFKEVALAYLMDQHIDRVGKFKSRLQICIDIYNKQAIANKRDCLDYQSILREWQTILKEEGKAS